jgi:hypothetical protein
MNNKIDIINEHVGSRIMAPTIPPPPTSSTNDGVYNFVKPINNHFVIDNNTLYNKLIDLESEIKALKNMIHTINYPKPTYYPMQPISYGAPPIPMSTHNINL